MTERVTADEARALKARVGEVFEDDDREWDGYAQRVALPVLAEDVPRLCDTVVAQADELARLRFDLDESRALHRIAETAAGNARQAAETARAMRDAEPTAARVIARMTVQLRRKAMWAK